jgi:hypothetical protein
LIRLQEERSSIPIELWDVASCSHEEELNERQKSSFNKSAKVELQEDSVKNVPLSGSTLWYISRRKACIALE